MKKRFIKIAMEYIWSGRVDLKIYTKIIIIPDYYLLLNFYHIINFFGIKKAGQIKQSARRNFKDTANTIYSKKK